MPGPNDYPIWIKNGTTLVVLHNNATTANLVQANAFLNNAQVSASWTAGSLYFKDPNGDCYTFSGYDPTFPAGGYQTAQWGESCTHGPCCPAVGGNANDNYYYNWRQWTECGGTTPDTKSITTAAITDSNSDHRQGSYEFYVQMGSPSFGEFVVYDGICWEYIDHTGDVAVWGLVYDVVQPVTALTVAYQDCSTCTSNLDYHLIKICGTTDLLIPVMNANGSSAINASENTAWFTSQNPSTGQFFDAGFGQCHEYMGLGDSSTAAGGVVMATSLMPHTQQPDCGCGVVTGADFHTWERCENSEGVVNIVTTGASNDSAANTAFYTSVNSPNTGQVVNFDTSKTSADQCYEYKGLTSSAETSYQNILIGTTSIHDTCPDCITPPTSGCTDPLANNYDASATVDDGSCTYNSGCTDPLATNYNSNATVDDGSCIYCTYGCTDATAPNYDVNATCDDGSCIVIEGGTGCTIAFGTEICNPDGTSSIDIDLSSGSGLLNVVTTVNGAPYGTPTGCATPPVTIPVTGLTEGETVSVQGECSYTKEDYDAEAGGAAPGWSFPDCGQSVQAISNDTKVYVFYDGTSMGKAKAQESYKGVMNWLDGLNDFDVDTVHGSPDQNVFHTAVNGERWLDWAIVPITGTFCNRQTPKSVGYKWTGGGANNNVLQSVTTQSCHGGSACFETYDNTTHLYGPFPYDMPKNGSRMLDICNWAHDTTTYSGFTVDPFYDTAEGTLVGQPMSSWVSGGSSYGTPNGSQVYIGAPPAAGASDVLVICFLDEAASVYHKVSNSPSFSIGETNVTHSGGNATWSSLSVEQPTQSWKDDYDEYKMQYNIHLGTGKTFKAFMYPATDSCNGSAKNLPMQALAGVHSGNNSIANGMWQVGTSPACQCHSNTIGADLTPIESLNPYWTGNTPTYGGLDQFGWGVNVDMGTFTEQIFIDDLTLFLGSGGTQNICDGSQCIFIKAVDENGVAISGHPITIDGTSIGNTDAAGVVSHTLNAPGSIVVNGCYTFAAVGSCYQSLITIEIIKLDYTTALNCILGCTDPTSWNYNPLAGIDDGSCMHPLTEDPVLSGSEICKIDTECKFATDVYNLYKYQRYGLDKGCLYNMDGHATKKYSTDWTDNLVVDYGAETMTKKTYTGNSLAECQYNCGEGEACDTGMDVAFVIDITSSMGPAINNVKAGVAAIVAQIVSLAGSSDYKLSLTFSDEGVSSTGTGNHSDYNPSYSSLAAYTGLPANQKSVVTGSNLSTDTGHIQTTGSPVGEYFDHWATNMEQFGTNNQSTFASQLSLINTAAFPLGNGQHWMPEPADMAVEMVGLQSFGGTWRNNVAKYIVVMTDDLPGGDNNTFNATDVARLVTLATNLSAQNIKAIVIGSGVGMEDPDNLGTYPWRVFAEATDGAWDTASGGDYSTATINALATLCDGDAVVAGYDGSECILVIVKNKDGDVIPDYEITLDGLYAGKTDEHGELTLWIPNAAEDNEHKINLCHCFTTTGVCGKSQKIEITVDGVDCDDCGNIKMF